MLRRLPGLAFALAGLLLPTALLAQDDAREVAELRRRIAIIRAQLPAITEAAEYAAAIFKEDTTKRILVSRSTDAGFHLEFYWHGGGPPDARDADDPAARGVVLLPVRHWEGIGLGVAMQSQQYRDQGRTVITFGSVADRPSISVGRRVLDNGAPNGDRALGELNNIANMVVAWAWYAELVAAATRDGWWTGTNLSVISPGATQHNASVRFVMPTPPPSVIPAGKLGGAYLDAIDALLATDDSPAHRALVARAADTLRARRRDGATLFVASCAHYLQEEIQRDTVATPFRPLDWRWDVAGKLRARGAAAGDGMLWFGYGGYDCPKVEVAGPFAEVGVRVVAVTDQMPKEVPSNVALHLPMGWRLPDAGAPIPFPPGSVAPTASVDMAVHYLWLKRLVGGNGER